MSRIAVGVGAPRSAGEAAHGVIAEALVVAGGDKAARAEHLAGYKSARGRGGEPILLVVAESLVVGAGGKSRVGGAYVSGRVEAARLLEKHALLQAYPEVARPAKEVVGGAVLVGAW